MAELEDRLEDREELDLLEDSGEVDTAGGVKGSLSISTV